MSESSAVAAPESGNIGGTIPTFEELAADPEIAALLEFEPVPVRRRVNGWDADAQRAFIALLAITGSKGRAAAAAGRAAAGIERLLKRPDADALRGAHDAALALFRRNHSEKLAHSFAAARKADPAIQAPGQILNEEGEWEDADSLGARAGDARDSVAGKLLRCRRLYLMEISGHPASRAAFEVLTQYPIDWDKAAQGLPQDDEPWRTPNMRKPDMLLTAESGWLGNVVPGPDNQAELMRAINEWRAEQGLEAVEGSDSTESSEQA